MTAYGRPNSQEARATEKKPSQGNGIRLLEGLLSKFRRKRVKS